MKDLFISFLKEYNLYYRFIAYYSVGPVEKSKTFEEYLEEQDPNHYVTGAFPWPKTDEGKDFWKGVDEHWDEYREKHSKWEYTIHFDSSKLDDSELIRDISKLLEEKYGVNASGNLSTRSVRLS